MATRALRDAAIAPRPDRRRARRQVDRDRADVETGARARTELAAHQDQSTLPPTSPSRRGRPIVRTRRSSPMPRGRSLTSIRNSCPCATTASITRASSTAAIPATDWRGLHSLASLPQAISPSTGWVMNTNNWPWTAAGAASPRAAAFPRYMDSAGENARGVHALLLLDDARAMTPQKLMTLAYDSYLPAFATLIPQLVAAYRRVARERSAARAAGGADRAAARLGQALVGDLGSDLARGVLGRCAGARRWRAWPRPRGCNCPIISRRACRPRPSSPRSTRRWRRWRATSAIGASPWGRINRFQRLDARIAPHFDDARPSIAVPFTSAQWGSLASYGARSYDNTKRYYGTSGNSFVAVVEFGPRLRAWAVMAGRAKRQSQVAPFRRPGGPLCRRADCGRSISIPPT